MVEDVVSLHPQLRADSFCKLHRFRECQVEINEARSVEVVAADAPRRGEQRCAAAVGAPGECIRIPEPDLGSRRIVRCVETRTATSCKRILTRDQIGPATQSGALHVGCTEDIERMASLNCRDASKLDTLENPSHDA